MSGYWTRHRLLQTIIFSVAVAIMVGLLFVAPVISQQADNYNSQSIYKNTGIDFVAPEPSFEQVNELPGTNGISKVFPFYMTSIQVSVNGKNRTTNVILSDQLDNIDFTMYSDSRIIEQLSGSVNNPLFVDWQFCHDTGADLGDSVSFSIGGNSVEYQISAIYETNSLYDGGAILAPITSDQKDTISANSKSNGYTGIYVSANDYNQCQSFMKSDYRPLGRLKDRSQFETDEQYQIHYDAIMSSGYANEITDFRIKENNLNAQANNIMILLGALLSVIAIIVFNYIMRKRGCEKVYLTKHCVPQGQNVKPYYGISFVSELLLLIVLYCASLFLAVRMSKTYIPHSAFGGKVFIVPCVFIVAEIMALILNNSSIPKANNKVEVQEESIANPNEQEEMLNGEPDRTNGLDELNAPSEQTAKESGEEMADQILEENK